MTKSEGTLMLFPKHELFIKNTALFYVKTIMTKLPEKCYELLFNEHKLLWLNVITN